jgi:uncharacterized protein YegP (UPF0339 family)
LNKFVLYKARYGFRWRLVASNGRIIADSGEAYRNKAHCQAAIGWVKQWAALAFVQDLAR